MTPPTGSVGLFASLKELAATLLAMGRTRLALLANELAIEKQRLVHLFVLAQLFTFCLSVGLLALAAWIVLAFWEARFFLMGGLAFAFLGLAAWLAKRVMELARPEPLLAATLEELEEDLRQLREASNPRAGATGESQRHGSAPR